MSGKRHHVALAVLNAAVLTFMQGSVGYLIWTICYSECARWSFGIRNTPICHHLSVLENRKRPQCRWLVSKQLPKVTVQLPIFNEVYVVERLLNSVSELDYPRELLQIQVLDDSTDDTRELTATLHRTVCAARA